MVDNERLQGTKAVFCDSYEAVKFTRHTGVKNRVCSSAQSEHSKWGPLYNVEHQMILVCLKLVQYNAVLRVLSFHLFHYTGKKGKKKKMNRTRN